MPDPRDTPAMRQYYRFKKMHPSCVLLFRIGDFYECFDDDAVTVSKALGLTLTRRTEGVPMAGVPHHQLENYLRRLTNQGFRVAVADQVQDPKDAKGIVDRDVTRVVTPGTLVDESLLDAGATARLAAVCPAGNDPPRLGAAIVELSTGSFLILDCPAGELADELARRGVRELLYPELFDGSVTRDIAAVVNRHGVAGTPRPDWQFRPTEAREVILKQFGVSSLAGFGLDEEDCALGAAGAALRYLLETQAAGEGQDPPGGEPTAGARRRATLAHLRPPRRENPSDFLILDAAGLRALEVERTIRSAKGAEGSLAGLFQGSEVGCQTPMGKRLVAEWLRRPLARRESIEARHRAVATLVEDRRTAAALEEGLAGVQDVARIAARVALRRATPRDVVGLARSLERLGPIAAALENAPAFAAARGRLEEARPLLGPLAADILARCVESPPWHLRDGGLVRDGVDAELDEARLLQRDAGEWMAAYQERLARQHDLPSLKVGFNKVFGYYIELPAAQARRAPAEFTRKQTLKNAERYITPELRDYERRVTTAQERALERERAIFEALCDAAGARIVETSAFADAVAELDALACFARRAARSRWTRPEMRDEPVLRVAQGRHPVLEELLGQGFVPNDLELGRESGVRGQDSGVRGQESGVRGQDAGPRTQDAGPSDRSPAERSAPGASPSPSLALITGPNMAGKSTFIRQAALIVLLAHAGSFVPAESAEIGLTDRVFTRVGADDALHAGQSTFMVEMAETAVVLNCATERSLVILDEIGRGTSTLDGLSLAWAIVEHLARPPGGGRGPRTLFATHYHELTDLEERLPGRVRNLHVAVREWGEEIVFLHRILPGRTDRSYGIHVARLAGVPGAVTRRAREVLDSLAVHHGPSGAAAAPHPARRPAADGQLTLFTEYLPHPALEALREMKLEALTPLGAFDELRRLKAAAESGGAAGSGGPAPG